MQGSVEVANGQIVGAAYFRFTIYALVKYYSQIVYVQVVKNSLKLFSSIEFRYKMNESIRR